MVDSCTCLQYERIDVKNTQKHLLYGQDVGGRLGGVFREAATLAQTFGDDRVFNTPIQEAYIIGSTVGMSAVGLKPFVEVQFADYIWPGLNQLIHRGESRSYYLIKWQMASELHHTCTNWSVWFRWTIPFVKCGVCFDEHTRN
jgi:2-oxoisovalerate dehydrogenase E1 component